MWMESKLIFIIEHTSIFLKKNKNWSDFIETTYMVA